MNKKNRYRVFLTALLVATLVLAGCSNNILHTESTPHANATSTVDSVVLGMSAEEVMDILGEPDEDIGSGTMIWVYTVEDVRIVIGFVIDTEGVFRVTSVSSEP